MDYLFYTCLFLFAADVSGVIIDAPLNAVAEVGQQAIFNCTSDLTIQNWILTAKREDLGTAAAQNIAINCVVQSGFTTHYDVDRPGGNTNCNLIVKNTTMQQAGIYTCSDIDRGPSAILTVIDSTSVITVNKTNDMRNAVESESVIIECVLNYNGTMPPAPTLRPYFYWTNFNGQNVSSSYDLTTENTSVSQLTVTAGRQDIMPYTCHVYFQLMPPNNTGYANDTPVVSNSATSPIIGVLYGPSIPAVITNRSEVITINGVACGINVFTCSSTGNPTPNYKWYDSAYVNVILSTVETLTLGEINRNYTCQAYNTIRNEMNVSSTTYRVSVADCTSTGECCLYPRDDTTSIAVEGCDNGTLCDCSQGSSGIKLVCSAATFPNASYMWNGPNGQVVHSPVYDRIKMNGRYRCNAYFDRTLSNYSGDVIFSNGSKEKTVGQCSASASTIGPSTTTTTPVSTGTQTTNKPSNGSKAGEYAGIAIACIIAVNGLATFFFIGYYAFNGNGSDTVNRNGNLKNGRNKIRLNKKFPRLQKMLPCLNDTKDTSGANFPWVLLFILLGALTGIVTFPVGIALAIKSETNDETSVLKKGDDTENENTENGRSSPSYPSSPTGKRTKAQPREDPYQNSAENIEVESSHHSRNHHPTDSPTSNASTRGKPPPPPKNKPTVNSPSCPMDYTINGSAALNYLEPTTYAELPIKPGNTGHTPSPVQLLVPDDPSDNYAVLNKT